MRLPEELRFRARPLPVFLTAEAAECGLGCLAMIGAYHGHRMDLNGLRQRFSVSSAGATLRGIMDFAGQLGFSTRALKVDMEALEHVHVPAIAHWDLQHFVVLKSVSRSKIVIHCPSRGAVTLSRNEFSQHYTGVILELEKAQNFETVTARKPVRLQSLWSESRGIWLSGFQILGVTLVYQILGFLAPFQNQLIVDDVIGKRDVDMLAVVSLAFAGLVLVQTVLNALRGWAMQVLSALFSFQLEGNIVRHMFRLPADFFAKRHMGDILSRIGSTGAIQDALTRGAITALLDGGMAIVACLLLFAYSVPLAFVVLAGLALSGGIAIGLYPVMRNRSRDTLGASAREQSYLMESIRAAQTIKLFSMGSEREGHWRNLFIRKTTLQLQAAKYQQVMAFSQDMISGLQVVLIMYLGARLVLDGAGFSVGMMVAFLSYQGQLTRSVFSCINEGSKFRMLKLHMDRLSDIVTAAPEAQATPSRAVEVRGEITVRQVSFRYGDNDPVVLDKVDLDIPAGDFLAITGPSGAGKSTLLKLLLGISRPTGGEILLDGQVATPAFWQGWRKRVGVVSQNDNLLSGTIAENIAFFDPELSMPEVERAAQQAHVHEDIKRMPMQYLSHIGDMGSALSGGQKQRILLARAFYRQPEILFLDEGTAHLDERTEESIAELLAELPITRIVVAHRPALIQRARRIAIVQNGKITFTRGSQKVVTGAL